jgi:nitrile hydratase accessory protein
MPGRAILSRPEALPDVLTGQPVDAEGAPVFTAPWQAKAFALTVHLHDRGAFGWGEWAAALGREVKDQAPGAEGYYAAWLRALERLLAEGRSPRPGRWRRWPRPGSGRRRRRRTAGRSGSRTIPVHEARAEVSDPVVDGLGAAGAGGAARRRGGVDGAVVPGGSGAALDRGLDRRAGGGAGRGAAPRAGGGADRGAGVHRGLLAVVDDHPADERPGLAAGRGRAADRGDRPGRSGPDRAAQRAELRLADAERRRRSAGRRGTTIRGPSRARTSS